MNTCTCVCMCRCGCVYVSMYLADERHDVGLQIFPCNGQRERDNNVVDRLNHESIRQIRALLKHPHLSLKCTA